MCCGLYNEKDTSLLFFDSYQKFLAVAILLASLPRFGPTFLGNGVAQKYHY